MIVGADKLVKSTLVTPEGQVQSLATCVLSPDQARTIRAYARDIGRALRLRFDRACKECGRGTRGRGVNTDPMEWEVNDDFIALACDCTMFSFSGPTPLAPSTPMQARPVPETILVDVNGNMAPRYEEPLTVGQAQLLRDYRARVLLPLGIVEATYCELCEDNPTLEYHGTTLRCGINQIHYECRHAVRHYQGSV